MVVIAIVMMVIQLLYLCLCFSTTDINIKKWGVIEEGATGITAYWPSFFSFLVSFAPGVK